MQLSKEDIRNLIPHQLSASPRLRVNQPPRKPHA